MGSVKDILHGWGNKVLDRFNAAPEGLKELASKRMKKCDSCPLRTGNVCDPKKSIKHVKTGKEIYGCGCNLSAKTMAPGSNCPAGKW